MQVATLQDCIGMPASEFVMHREPMLLLDTLVECSGGTTVCEWTVGERDSFVVSREGVPAHVGVEFMAQCVAVHAGVRARVDGLGPPLGFLLGTRHFTASVNYFGIGETYRATCRELIRDGNGMGSYECSILHGDEVVASARLAVLEKEQGRPLT
jgi:predicted hotdog family 3-hydroxylacyl-ACP dehydratase